ncbi:MAG: PqqD family protein [Candidatus Latescibacterota bacterium]|nr:MAG: PqqD family protein [Candidatus Latescibacterota bacterium]
MANKEENLLDMIPWQRRDHRDCADGTVDVMIPRFGDSRIGRFLGKSLKNTPIHVHLDEIGTAVWRLCDGRRSVQDIGRSLQEQFGDRIEPVYERLGIFLHQMKKAGIIDWRR